MAEGSEDRPSLSHWRRLAGMLFEPRRVMEDLTRRPRWILPVALSLVPSTIIFVGVELQLLSWRNLHRLPSEFLYYLVTLGAGFFAETAGLFLSALMLVGLMRALSRTLGVRHALALVSYSLVPGILVSLMNHVFHAGVLWLQLESPLPHWFWLNAASFLDRSASHPLVYSLVGQIGVFPLWRWLLVALGLTIVVRSVSFRVAFGVAVVALVLVGSIWSFAWISATKLFMPALP